MFGLKDQDLMFVLFVVFGFFLAKMLSSKKEGINMQDCPAYDKVISNGHCDGAGGEDFTLTKECCEDLKTIDNKKCKDAIYQSVPKPGADIINNNINECKRRKRRENAISKCSNDYRNCICDGGTEAECNRLEKNLEYEGIKCSDIEYNKNVEELYCKKRKNAIFLCKNYWSNCMCNSGTEAKCNRLEKNLEYEGIKCTDIEYDKNVDCPVLFWTDCDWEPECPPGSRPWPGAYLSTDGCFPGFTRAGCTRSPRRTLPQ
uniref:Uncharacterized protein n=1 Tax=viral metagenome TaxID=1070528 RepID=A0A6C0FED1_9ZZZZ|tara:strand:- start:2686 stop:3462 length:777 start_codon:yes stop_codon:yes gene_type:complete